MFQSNLGLNMVKIGVFGEKVCNPVPCSDIAREASIITRRGEYSCIAREASNPASNPDPSRGE